MFSDHFFLLSGLAKSTTFLETFSAVLAGMTAAVTFFDAFLSVLGGGPDFSPRHLSQW